MLSKIILILVSIFSFLITYFLTPFVRNLSIKKGLLEIPTERKDHKLPIVRLGGIAIFSGFIISISGYLITSRFSGFSIFENKLFFLIFGIHQLF